jgi:hypothetical protein
MKPTPQPAYADFVPKFMRLLFADGDTVALGRIDAVGNWSESKHTLDRAVALLLANQDTPNLYFRASAMAGGSGCGADNCASARALFLDVDYGGAGHKRKSPFKTADDVVGYLLTMPLRPSLAWHTGHGVQCAFLLKEPCVFPASGGSVEDLLGYRSAGAGLVKLAMADAAFTPEHAYRVPLTVNSKAYKEPGLADVRGQLLWCDERRRYALSEIEAACAGHGIADLLNEDEAPAHHPEPDGKVSDYAKLPQDLRDEIEASGAERSDRLFGIVGRMVRLGHGDGFIAAAVGRGTDFVEKYGHRRGGLRREVEQCAAKIRSGHYVYGGRSAPPVLVYNVPVPVALSDCAPLAPAFEAALKGYAKAAGAVLLPRVLDAARFHEHLHSTHTSGVIESPCGAGKSVWALCHIAAHAAEDNRYVYVTETVDALHRAADMLSRLTPVPVGRVHGFNAAQCLELCGVEHTWKQCGRSDTRSLCNACPVSSQCAYHTRAQQERLPVLCMTHAGFIRAMEDGSGLLGDANVIVDEGLSPFDSWSVGLDELRRMLSWLGASEHMLGLLWPGTSIAVAALSQYGLAGDADVFARRNYCFRSENQTAALAEQLTVLRALLRKGSGLAGFGSHSDDPEKARDTLAGLLNFFRPSVRGDSTYAYTETKTAGGWSIQCKRSAFSLGGGGDWRSLWLLNASAQLSPFPYPQDMPVYTCPDLKGNSALVTLHIVRANPVKTRQEEAVRVAGMAMVFGQCMRNHRRVLVCADKASDRAGEIAEHVRGICGDDAEVTVLSRGRIKGVNSAGDCTLALLQGMSTFTGVSDCALHACLQYRRAFPDTPYVYTQDGAPNWPGGRMLVPAMRNYYALRSLDEIYQALWRTAVRNDRPVEAVVVVPDAHWLAALYRTVMPECVIGSAYKEKPGAETYTGPDGSAVSFQWDWVRDEELYGVGICAVPAGQEIAKADVAMALGYAGARAWDRHRDVITAMLEGVFGEGRNNRWLRRL